MLEPARWAPPFTELDAERVISRTRAPTASGSYRLSIEVTPHGDRTDVAIRGELDLDADRHIEPGLHAALDHSVHGLDFRLDGVHFCDCAGLGTLLHLRTRALDQDKTVALRTSSHAVDRILHLTGTRHLFTAANPADGDAAPAPPDSRVPQQDSDQQLRTEVAQLRQAMETRPVIDLARGILMATFALSPEAAWNVLVATSQNTNTKLRRLAQNLVENPHENKLSEALQQQLLTAIAGGGAAASTKARTPSRCGTVPRQRTAPPGE
ncbi:ANTAR domain-containing protein [Streptomyces sp. NPDC018019]|uniref:ANTAR domain-containing protein n=1 Tax=Streptomyces sp. NPDC018019 TaxID=3365030 RepID=UPI00378B8EA8